MENLLVAFLTILLSFSTLSPAIPVSYDKVVENTEDYIIEVYIPQLNLIKDEAEKDKINESLTQEIQNTITMLKEDSVAYEEKPSPYGLYLYPRQVYFDDDYLSLGMDYADYWGGAHGYNAIISYNFHRTSGQVLYLGDLYEADDLAKLTNNLKDSFEDYEVFTFDGEAPTITSAFTNFLITEDEIILYFNPYEIAPYAVGILTFTADRDSLEIKAE